MSEDFREEAEKHWKFINDLLDKMTEINEFPIEMIHYLYVEAMIHGYKHAFKTQLKKEEK
jgi:hypothetical protein